MRDGWIGRGPWASWVRRTALPLSLIGVLLTPSPPARADDSADAKRRIAASVSALEDSSAAVQAAGAALARTAEELPPALEAVARANGVLAGAQARVAAAEREVRRGELQVAAAVRRAEQATAAVAAGRLDVGRLARRSYQLGPLQDVRALTDSGPGELLDRATSLQQVFRSADDGLHQLSRDRFAQATTQARLVAVQAALDGARDAARQRRDGAAAMAAAATRAQAQVTALVAERAAALGQAQAAKAADQQEYADAQAASRALAARIRAAAAARARAAAVARRQALEAARRAHVPPPAAEVVQSVGRFLWPADGPLTSRFGMRFHPIFHEYRFHAGIDIGAGYGSRVSAAEAGTVVYAGAASGYGTLVVISHGTDNGVDLSTAYAHMSALYVTEGQVVGRGQPVGAVGNEGNSTGPHLHFEVRRDGNPVDPLGYVSPP